MAGDEKSFQLDWGTHAVLKLLSSFQFQSVLDIGSGEGEHKRLFEYFDKNIFSVDIVKAADYCGDFITTEFDQKFDAIWCSHVLEHQRNVGLFLDKIYDLLNDDGALAIVVPIHPRERLISGHLTSWSIPLLCYNLILAGFDCAKASILSTYELSLIVKKVPAIHSELNAVSAHGADAEHELDNIRAFFPFEANQGVNINVEGVGTINWGNVIEYTMPAMSNGQSTITVHSKNLLSSPTLTPKLFW